MRTTPRVTEAMKQEPKQAPIMDKGLTTDYLNYLRNPLVKAMAEEPTERILEKYLDTSVYQNPLAEKTASLWLFKLPAEYNREEIFTRFSATSNIKSITFRPAPNTKFQYCLITYNTVADAARADLHWHKHSATVPYCCVPAPLACCTSEFVLAISDVPGPVNAKMLFDAFHGFGHLASSIIGIKKGSRHSYLAFSSPREKALAAINARQVCKALMQSLEKPKPHVSARALPRTANVGSMTDERVFVDSHAVVAPTTADIATNTPCSQEVTADAGCSVVSVENASADVARDTAGNSELVAGDVKSVLADAGDEIEASNTEAAHIVMHNAASQLTNIEKVAQQLAKQLDHNDVDTADEVASHTEPVHKADSESGVEAEAASTEQSIDTATASSAEPVVSKTSDTELKQEVVEEFSIRSAVNVESLSSEPSADIIIAEGRTEDHFQLFDKFKLQKLAMNAATANKAANAQTTYSQQFKSMFDHAVRNVQPVAQSVKPWLPAMASFVTIATIAALGNKRR